MKAKRLIRDWYEWNEWNEGYDQFELNEQIKRLKPRPIYINAR